MKMLIVFERLWITAFALSIFVAVFKLHKHPYEYLTLFALVFIVSFQENSKNIPYKSLTTDDEREKKFLLDDFIKDRSLDNPKR